MRLDVILSPGEAPPAFFAGRTVVVLDILRASTTIVHALSEGARAVFPVGSIEEALRMAHAFGRDDVLLTGERKCLPIEGFDLGNSPFEYTREKVGGKTLVMTTTNGTAAMVLTTSAHRVLIGSMVNFTAVINDLVANAAEPVFLCAGRERFFSLEDAACAGEFAERLMQVRPGDWVLNDGARAAISLAREFGTGQTLFELAKGGKALIDAGLPGDLEFCARIDTHDVVPVLHERSVTLHEPLIGSSP